MQVLLALLIAHLVGDFVVQRGAVIDGKRAGRGAAFAEHGAWHLACLVSAWWLFAPVGIDVFKIAGAFVIIVVSHLLADWVKYRAPSDHAIIAFVLDQAFHLGVLLLAAWWLIGRPDWFGPLTEVWQSASVNVGWLTVAYLVVVVVCGWFNRLLLDSLLPGTDGEQQGLARAGLFIGWLERFLMFSAFLVQAWAALGLVLAAKSVFRFESIRSQRENAEYFVIGTLLSVSQVVVVGMLYMWLISSKWTGGV